MVDYMVQMDSNDLKERDLAIDLESGTNALINGFARCDESSKLESATNDANSVKDLYESGGDLSVCLLEKKKKKKTGADKPKKKSCKKPPKPPRPPRAPSMDAADQKMIREMNELAMLKRARVERMKKALKRMKNAKTASSNGNLIPWIITLIFCVVIIWQGVFPRGSSSLRFHGSPEASSVGARGGFISVQFYNSSGDHDSISASPSNVEQVSGLDNHEDGSRAAG